jgi:hypothetical protein
MATSTATPRLEDLARRIAQQEATLTALRRKLDARLSDLNRRRERLRAELRSVEAEIEAVAQGGSAGDQVLPVQFPSSPVETSKSRTVAPSKRPAGSRFTLSEFLVRLVREQRGKPLSMKELQEQTVQRGFPSTSTNLPRLVKKRAYELVERGVLSRDRRTGGFVLPPARNGSPAAAPPAASAKAHSATKSAATTLSPAAKAVPRPRMSAAPRAGGRKEQPALRSMLLNVLRKAGRTLSAQEMADAVQKAGYKSQSKDFRNVVWAAMGNMPEAERDPRGGYRLRKGKN